MYMCCWEAEAVGLVDDIEGLLESGKRNEEGSYVQEGLYMVGLLTAA